MADPTGGGAGASKTKQQIEDENNALRLQSEKYKELYDWEVKLAALANGKLDRYEEINKQLEDEINSAKGLVNEKVTLIGALEEGLKLAKEAAEVLANPEAAAASKLAEIAASKFGGMTAEQVKQAMREYQDKIDIQNDEARLAIQKIANLRNEKGEIEELNNKYQARSNFNREMKGQIDGLKVSTLGLNSSFAKGIAEGLHPMQAFLKQIADQFQKLFDDVMQGNQKFAAETGQIADRSIKFGTGMSQFGIGFKEMNESAIELFSSMSGFTTLNRDTQEQLSKTAAQMKLFGVSGASMGASFDNLSKSLKMTAKEASDTTNALAREAIGAGIAPKKMLEEFGPAMSKFAAYGKQGVQVYVDMQKAAKSLGIEMNSLTAVIGDQFDTFEDSAKAAGKLNAVLGGDFLNSVDMLNATESERIILLKKSFDQSGKNFDQLSKYEKKAIASAIGIKDLNEANKLLGKDTYELERDMASQAATQEKLEAVQREAAETTKSLSEAFNGLLIVVRPIVELVKMTVNLLTAFMDLGGGVVGIVVSIAGAIWGLAYAFGGVNLAAGKTALFFTLFALAVKGLHYWLLEPHSPILFEALKGLPPIVDEVGEAASKNKEGMIALGLATMMVGAGVYFAAEGLADLVSSFKGLGDAAPIAAAGMAIFLIAFTVMVLILAKLSPVTAAASLGVLALGAAVLMLGAGIALAAMGMKDIVDSVIKLSSLGAEAAASIFLMSAGILALAAASVLMIIGSFGITALTSAIKDIKKAIGTDTTEAFKAFGESMLGLYAVLSFEGVEDSISVVVRAIRSIGEEIEKVISDKEKMITFTTSMNSLNNVLTTAKTIKEEDLKPTKEFLTKAKEYYLAQAGAKDSDKDALLAIVRELQKINQTTNTAKSNTPMRVKLVVGNNEADALLYGFNTKTSDMIQG